LLGCGHDVTCCFVLYKRRWDVAIPVGAAAGCDLLIFDSLEDAKRSQPSAAPTGVCVYFHQYSTCNPTFEPCLAVPKAPVSDNAEPCASSLAARLAASF